MNKAALRIVAATFGAGAIAFALAANVVAQVSAEAPAPMLRVEHTIPLAEAFPDNAATHGHVFRARQLVLGPGARTELIDHQGRPSITYVTQGVVREHRVGVAQPLVHQVGAATMDRGAVSHFWENTGPGEAILLVVEVTPSATP